jgi:hypothetical protein
MGLRLWFLGLFVMAPCNECPGHQHPGDGHCSSFIHQWLQMGGLGVSASFSARRSSLGSTADADGLGPPSSRKAARSSVR